MAISKGIIVFKGDKGSPEGHFTKSRIMEVTDAVALTTLVAALSVHTNCNIAKHSFSSTTGITTSPPGGDPPVNVDRKAILYFTDLTDMSTHSFTLPAPVDADVELQDQGERITAAAMTTLVGLLNDATGKSYTPLYGVVIQPR